MNLEDENRKLKLFTGSKDLNFKKPKKEVKFSQNDKQNIYGGQNYSDNYQSNLNKSRYISAELPFVQKKIAPGIGIGVNGISQKGIHPDTREYELPKNIDELRAKNNPRISYKGKIINGKSNINKRDSNFNFTKFKNPTIFENRPLESTGASIKKNKNRGKYLINDNNRNKYVGEVKGPSKGLNKIQMRGKYRDANKKENDNVDNNRNLRGDNKFNLNKKSYNMELLKKEIQSILPYEKELHMGNFLEALLPSSHYTDEAKQTVRETTENYGDKNILNLKSNSKTQNYFNDKAKQTVRETTENYGDKNIINLKANNKTQNYFSDKAKPTIKETTVHNIKDVLNIKLYKKLPRRVKQTKEKTKPLLLKKEILKEGEILPETEKIIKQAETTIPSKVKKEPVQKVYARPNGADIDPIETREWLDSLDAVISNKRWNRSCSLSA
jgi:hypothetical protein